MEIYLAKNNTVEVLNLKMARSSGLRYGPPDVFTTLDLGDGEHVLRRCLPPHGSRGTGSTERSSARREQD